MLALALAYVAVVMGEKIVISASDAFDAGVVPDGHRGIGVEADSWDAAERAHVDSAKIVIDKEPGVPGVSGKQPAGCDVVISTPEDIDGTINADPSTQATKFCLAAGTHTASDTLILKDGDSLTGPIGSQVSFGPATYGVPQAKIVGEGIDKVVSADGSNITIEWVDVSGGDGRIDASRDRSTCPSSNLPSGCPVVGTGIGIALGQCDGSTDSQERAGARQRRGGHL